MKILLIEDSRFLRVAIETLLVKAGHEGIAVADGREALPAARSSLPAFVRLDMMLPGLDGTCVLEELKQDASTSHIPAIVLSGSSQKNEPRLRKAGAAAYMEKSSFGLEKNPDALVQAVARALGSSGAIQSAIGEHNAPSAHAGVNQSEHRVGCSRMAA
jgi:CheY-like chemotaxis protein